MAIFDCFMFFNELDLLEIRLNTLATVVDYFVLTEATTTFSGEPKPLHYEENKGRFTAFADKIIHVVVDDMPVGTNVWFNERFQRDAAVRGLTDAKPNDIVMISDVDEIPFPDLIATLTPDATTGKIYFFECVYYTYKLNLKIENKWVALCAVRAIQKRYLTSMQALRSTRVMQSKRYPDWLNSVFTSLRNRKKYGAWLRNVRIPEAGWHFTFVNTPEKIQYKIASYAHQERNTPKFNSLENIERLIHQGTS
ncbi:MAG: N-acetylglucosaminyltransferase, partial [Acidiferrobacterales bacterium]